MWVLGVLFFDLAMTFVWMHSVQSLVCDIALEMNCGGAAIGW